MSSIAFQILGIGAWGPSFEDWSELSNTLQSSLPGHPQQAETPNTGPKPEVIPANERRRAPLPVRLAIESSWQAVQQAEVDPAETPCVFVSGIGDTQLTDYMCRAVAGDTKALSPTKFHNSVHNAAAGYWTISTGCMHAANSVAGFQESASLALMEALIQCEAESKAVLLTLYDAPSSKVLMELLKNEHAFSVSLVLAPAGTSATLPKYLAEVENMAGEWPAFESTELLQACYQTNPAAKILPLLKAILSPAGDFQAPLHLPMSAASRLTITRCQN